jgi:hypothetical protein
LSIVGQSGRKGRTALHTAFDLTQPSGGASVLSCELQQESVMRIIVAGIVYGLICLATGALLGPLRVLFLEPRLGLFVARLLEAPALLIAMFFASRFVVSMFGLRVRYYALLAVGLLAFCVVPAIDFFVGRMVRNVSIEEQISAFSSAPGLVYGVLLLALIVMPTVSTAIGDKKVMPGS